MGPPHERRLTFPPRIHVFATATAETQSGKARSWRGGSSSAGVRFVTITVGGWDYHTNIGKDMLRNVTMTDSAVGCLVEDLSQRGLLNSTIVMVMGEFGRTPRINPQAGRDHWGEVMSVMAAGGGFPGGAVVGSSNAKGELPKDLPITPADLLTTLYHKLGIDPSTTFVNRSGRPISIGSNGRLIEQLV